MLLYVLLFGLLMGWGVVLILWVLVCRDFNMVVWLDDLIGSEVIVILFLLFDECGFVEFLVCGSLLCWVVCSVFRFLECGEWVVIFRFDGLILIVDLFEMVDWINFGYGKVSFM